MRQTGGMITICESVVTARPRPEVFAYLADFTTVAEWDPGIVASRLDTGDGGVGSVYAVTAAFRGREVPMTYEVVGLAAPERIVVRGTGKAVDAIDTIECFDHDGGTRVVYTAEFRLKGVVRLAAPFLRGVFRRLGETAMGGLDRALNG